MDRWDSAGLPELAWTMFGGSPKRADDCGRLRHGHMIASRTHGSHGPCVQFDSSLAIFNHNDHLPALSTAAITTRSSRTSTSARTKTMAKHSLAYPAVPASAPTSPAVTRKDRNAPATPQRSLQRASLRQLHSPYTPLTSYSTPYTPMSLRSLSSSNASSLATPASLTSNRRLSLSLSPEVSFQGKNNKKSLADIADNWRTRANENGIKVTSSEES